MDLQYCGKTVNCLYYKGCPVSCAYYKGQLVYQKKYYTVCLYSHTLATANFGDSNICRNGYCLGHYCCWGSLAQNCLDIYIGGNITSEPIAVTVKVSNGIFTYSCLATCCRTAARASLVPVDSVGSTMINNNYIMCSGGSINLDVAKACNCRYYGCLNGSTTSNELNCIVFNGVSRCYANSIANYTYSFCCCNLCIRSYIYCDMPYSTVCAFYSYVSGCPTICVITNYNGTCYTTILNCCSAMNCCGKIANFCYNGCVGNYTTCASICNCVCCRYET